MAQLLARTSFTACMVGAGLLTFTATAALASSKPNASRVERQSIRVSARPISTFSKSGGSNRFGRLRFIGGLVLSSSAREFGGYSGLELSPDGSSLLAVSDAGTWLRANLVYARGRPVGIAKATIGPLLALKERRLTRGRDRDAEVVRLFNGNLTTGTVLIGFERNQRIGFFKLSDGQPKSPSRYIRPPIRLSSNKGIEAAAVLRAGRYKGAVIAFAERSIDPNGHHRGWLWHSPETKPRGIALQKASLGAAAAVSAAKVRPIALTDIAGFDITDVAGDADGGLYTLERRFRWSEGVQMRIRHIAAADIKPGAVLRGDVLLEADMRYEIDNMEGLAVHRDKSNRTLLSVISDNNFNSFLQRTMLLQFELTK